MDRPDSQIELTDRGYAQARLVRVRVRVGVRVRVRIRVRAHRPRLRPGKLGSGSG